MGYICSNVGEICNFFAVLWSYLVQKLRIENKGLVGKSPISPL